jgi:hypothetical protein
VEDIPDSQQPHLAATQPSIVSDSPFSQNVEVLRHTLGAVAPTFATHRKSKPPTNRIWIYFIKRLQRHRLPTPTMGIDTFCALLLAAGGAQQVWCLDQHLPLETASTTSLQLWCAVNPEALLCVQHVSGLPPPTGVPHWPDGLQRQRYSIHELICKGRIHSIPQRNGAMWMPG